MTILGQDREKILHDWSKSGDPIINSDLCLHELFEKQVAKTPQTRAVIFGNDSLTYQQLNEEANYFAHILKQKGVEKETIVGLYLEYSLEMVIGLLGILKAGGAFVPLDLDYPKKRLSFIIKDTQAEQVVTLPKCLGRLPENTPVIDLKRMPSSENKGNLENTVKSHHLACCLYTSGSTGVPKGVLIEHHSLVHNCYHAHRHYQMREDDRSLQFSPLNSVAGLEQILTPLTIGATLVLRGVDLWTPAEFTQKIKDYQITVVDLMPSYFHLLLEHWRKNQIKIENSSLRLIIAGGEGLSPSTIKLWLELSLKDHLQLINAYGLTEVPILAIKKNIGGDEETKSLIGRPVGSWQTYILDSHGEPVPVNTSGELHIGGPGLARGYLNQPELTKSKFIKNPFLSSENARLYKTGDLARYLCDGTIEYLGRMDHQVQLRGFRIELGEIESILQSHSEVKHAVVIVYGEGMKKQLVGYIVPEQDMTEKIQGFWKAPVGSNDSPEILQDSLERMEFKLKQNNIRSSFPLERKETLLAKPKNDKAHAQKYLNRQSYRQFTNKQISFEKFSQFLSCLEALNLAHIPIPKYRYPSALGLYPIQSYLYIKKDVIENLDEGFYYYHPLQHSLIFLSDKTAIKEEFYGHTKSIAEQSSWTLLLVADMDAISPLYGKLLGERFALLEAGHIGQLLMEEAPKYDLGLCPIGVEYISVEDEIYQILGLKPNDMFVYGFLGGSIEPFQKENWLPSTQNRDNKKNKLVSELQDYAEKKLPMHMIPSTFVLLESLPLASSGKIDRKALPAHSDISDISDTANNSKADFVEPTTELEIQLAKIWNQLLKRNIGVKDNFFRVGGNSLLAIRLLSQIEEQFSCRLSLSAFFKDPTISMLVESLEDIQGKKLPLVAPKLPEVVSDPLNRYEPFPLTDVQQAYWIGQNDLFELGQVTIHDYRELESENLDLSKLNESLSFLIHRHEMLRAIILSDGTQKILKEVPSYEIKLTDLGECSSEEQSLHLEKIRERMDHHVFAPKQWPPFEICATRCGKKTRLHLSFQAIMIDWASWDILFYEWRQLYYNPNVFLPKLEVSFRDYVGAEKQLRNLDLYHSSRKYWFDRVPSLPPAPQLPFAKLTSQTKPKFTRYQFSLLPDQWQSIQSFARKRGVTESVVLIAAFAEILSKWSKDSHFVLNLTLFHRLALHENIDQIIGDFTSLILLEIDYRQPASFKDKLSKVQEQLAQDLENRYISGVQVIREIARQKRGMSQALMPVVFTSGLGLGNMKEELPSFGEEVYGITQTPQVLLDHQVLEENGKLVTIWDVVEDLFPPCFIQDMFRAHCEFLVKLAEDEKHWENEPFSFFSFFSFLPESHLLVQKQANETQASISAETLHSLFIKSAMANSERTAIITSDFQLSYKELYEKADHLSQVLVSAKIESSLVAIVMDKGWEQVVAVLAILMAGKAYLPIDCKLPQNRQVCLLEQGKITHLLTQEKVWQKSLWLENWHMIVVDIVETSEISQTEVSLQTPCDLAYVIYTSGSTGIPKGVMIDHRGAVNTILDINERFNVTPEDRVLALSALNFDLSVYDIFGVLAAGGTIVIPEASKNNDPSHWKSLMKEHGITIWNTVPALMQMLVDCQEEQSFNSLRLIMMSGDWIPIDLPNRVKKLSAKAQVFSLGGATEASIWSIYYPIEKILPSWKSIPYGKPLTNQTFFVLDKHLQTCPLWVTGDLYIGGVGLAKGYWGDSQTTDNKFIVHPKTKERLYRTGDLGRYLPDGNIEFLGRDDFQVKIRGHRIELGEIETSLLDHSAVKEAIVQVHEESGIHQLIAYIVLQKKQWSVLTEKASTEQAIRDHKTDIQEYLREKLPDYMVPRQYVFLDALPLTINGKVDRNALPKVSAPNISKEKVAPRTNLERELAQMCEQMLGIKLGIFDDFFDLGGDSLFLIRLISKVEKKFSIHVPLRLLMEKGTVDVLSRYLESTHRLQQKMPEKGPREEMEF